MLRLAIAIFLLSVLVPAAAGASERWTVHYERAAHAGHWNYCVKRCHHTTRKWLTHKWSRHLKRYHASWKHRPQYKNDRIASTSGQVRDSVQHDCMVWARSEGGPCGCFAQHLAFGNTLRLFRGWNLWLADTWRQVFPRVEAAVGTFAVWPGRHVAKVVGVDARRVLVHDSWATHWVSRSGLVFVMPPEIERKELVRYSAVPL